MQVVKRYRLQRKEPVSRPNIVGNYSCPVHTYRWIDIAISDDKEALKEIMPKRSIYFDYRIEDREAEV